MVVQLFLYVDSIGQLRLQKNREWAEKTAEQYVMFYLHAHCCSNGFKYLWMDMSGADAPVTPI